MSQTVVYGDTQALGVPSLKQTQGGRLWGEVSQELLLTESQR